MLNNFKWIMSKNDPAKLLALYGESPAMHSQIISRLLELKAIPTLLEIASRDDKRRFHILELILDELDLSELLHTLNLVADSSMNKQVLQSITKKYSPEEIRQASGNVMLDRNTRKFLQEELGESNSSGTKLSLRADYAKLRELMDETDFSGFPLTSLQRETDAGALEAEHLADYIRQRGQWKGTQEYDFIKQEIIFWCKKTPFNMRFILSLLGISILNAPQRVKLILDSHQIELYYPENFEFLTESAELPFENFRVFLSPNTIEHWLKIYQQTHPTFGFMALAQQFECFQWLTERYTQNSMVQLSGVNTSIETYDLTTRFGYQMHELISDPKIRKHLLESCKELRDGILQNLSNENFPLEKYIRPLIWIGGEENFAFLSGLMNRRVVENYDRTIQEIELNYSQLKKQIDDLQALTELVRNELAEKANLIPTEKHRIISTLFFTHLTSISKPSVELTQSLIAHLPMLDQFVYTTDEQNRIHLCRFIGILHLQQYSGVLHEFLADNNPLVAIEACATLAILNDPIVGSLLHQYSESSNYLIRKRLIETLRETHAPSDEALLLSLARDTHPEVCRAAYQTIAELPADNAINLFRNLIPDVYHRNRKELAKCIGQLNVAQAIPLLVDLVADSDPDDYLQIIRALGGIHHRLSHQVLNLLDLKRNPYLEIERARALVRLGYTSGWRTLERYLNLPSGPVSFYAKIAFLLHGSGEFLSKIREFTYDSDPVVSTLAAGKLFLYREDEGWETVQRLIKNRDNEAQYHLALLLPYLPFQRIKGHLFTLWQQGDYAVKTAVALTFTENGLPNYLAQIENSLPLSDTTAMLGIIRAMKDHQIPQALSMLRQISQNYQSEGIDDVLDILLNLDPTETLRFAMLLWKKPSETVRIAVAKIMGKIPDPRIVPFINTHIEHATPAVMAELAYALLVQGDESGWDYFNQLLMSDNAESYRFAIAKLSQLNRRETYDLLVRHLGNAGEILHAEIIKAFGSMQIREALPLLAKYLMNPSDKLRIAVAKALGDIGNDEAQSLLSLLSKDKDEYVRVAVEIAQQKSNRVSEWSSQSISDLLPQIFQPTNWRLNEPWFRRVWETFAEQSKRYSPQPIESLVGKSFLDEERLENKIQEIQNALSIQLIGCTDVERILQVKQEANQQIEALIPRGLLVRSLMEMNRNIPNDSEVESLINWAKSGDESVHLAIIFASAASTSGKWLSILSAILDSHDNSSYYDPILFSVSRKLSGCSLPLMVRLLHYDRARYYLLFQINYFLLNPDSIQLQDIREAKEALNRSDASSHFKEATASLLNILLEHKL